MIENKLANFYNRKEITTDLKALFGATKLSQRYCIDKLPINGAYPTAYISRLASSRISAINNRTTARKSGSFVINIFHERDERVKLLDIAEKLLDMHRLCINGMIEEDISIRSDEKPNLMIATFTIKLSEVDIDRYLSKPEVTVKKKR